MNLNFQDKVAVITGGAKGIGAATSRAFHAEGAKVALLDLDPDGLSVTKAMGDRALFVSCDVSQGDAVADAMSKIIKIFGGIDILVNNAGIQHYGTVTNTSESDWDKVLGVNLKSAFLCSKYAIPSMLSRGAGAIVNIASVQSFVSQNNVAAYTTSKTALLGLTRSIAVDYAPDIRCVAVCPGTIDTPMLHWAVEQSPAPDAVLEECRDMHLAKRIGTPEEIADLVLFLASDRAKFMTGQYYRIDGGLGLKVAGSKQS